MVRQGRPVGVTSRRLNIGARNAGNSPPCRGNGYFRQSKRVEQRFDKSWGLAISICGGRLVTVEKQSQNKNEKNVN